MSSPPTTLGQYQIIREIARSNDIVYEAYDPLMNRRVAIKELLMPPGSTPQQQEDRISRFKREAQAAGTLSHPNIMTVYSFAEDAGRTFMAMEFLDGTTLRAELDTKGSLSVPRAVEIASAVLSGLEHAHSKGVIHRDIKPDNIQLLTNGMIKITDFGIARLTFQPNLTMDGQVFGTPSYMSPEQVVGREIDARSDLFSVGVMLYEMLTGKKPFSGDSVVSTTYAIMNKDPEQPPNLNWGIWSVISRSLEKSPIMRYANAADMRSALEEAVNPNVGRMPTIDPHAPPGYLPSSNPYAPQTPPPPPPAALAGPIMAPYNPYSAPDPNANPYAGQYGQPPPAPAGVTFSYDPYQPGAQYGAAATPMTQMPAFYAPPRPKVPLFKPETVMFVKKLFVALLLMGTAFTVLYILMNSIAQEANSGDLRRREQQAAVGNQQANQDARHNKPELAEDEYLDVLKTDKENLDALDGLAALYSKKADSTSDPVGKAQLYLQSANRYQEEANNQVSVDQKMTAGKQFAQAAINAGNWGQGLSDQQDLRRQIRFALESAKAYVNNDQFLSSGIDQQLLSYGG